MKGIWGFSMICLQFFCKSKITTKYKIKTRKQQYRSTYRILLQAASMTVTSLERLLKNPACAQWEGFHLDSAMSLNVPKPGDQRNMCLSSPLWSSLWLRAVLLAHLPHPWPTFPIAFSPPRRSCVTWSSWGEKKVWRLSYDINQTLFYCNIWDPNHLIIYFPLELATTPLIHTYTSFRENQVKIKIWKLIFVCFSSSAIHQSLTSMSNSQGAHMRAHTHTEFFIITNNGWAKFSLRESRKISIKNKNRGHSGGSVSWEYDSWFLLRSWSHGSQDLAQSWAPCSQGSLLILFLCPSPLALALSL